MERPLLVYNLILPAAHLDNPIAFPLQSFLRNGYMVTQTGQCKLLFGELLVEFLQRNHFPSQESL
jgi:hypothetical protein